MELQQTQTQKLSQRQLYSVELLRLSTLELEGYVRELAQENPLVELEEAPPPSQGEGKDDLLARLRWLEDNDRQNWFYQKFSDEELDPLTRVGTGGGLEETLVSFLVMTHSRGFWETGYKGPGAETLWHSPCIPCIKLGL